MAGKKWIVCRQDEEALAALAAAGCGPVLARLLANRGISGAAEAERFLTCADGLCDAFSMAGMRQAAARLAKAVETGERMIVYGDYDVDGVTATALLLRYLLARGANAGCYIPERETEGYGLNREALRGIRAAGASLVVTVDTGISAFEEAEYAAEIGLDLVITDHHEPRSGVPRACAVVNPKRTDCPYPFKGLAGVGVAFKLVCALDGGDPDRLFEEYGDLVCLGTVADVVPLLGENRTIVRRGLALAEHSRNRGVRAILSVAGLSQNSLSATRLSFTAAPRINAAGRMGSAKDALRLFLAEDDGEAERLARQLDTQNRERQDAEAAILESAVHGVECGDVAEGPILMAVGEGWHRGVIGIVASRLAELYGKPAIVVSMEGDEGCASCRSFPGFPLHEALGRCASLLLRFGGHALAAGFSVRRENIEPLRSALYRYAGELGEIPGPALHLECELQPDEITLATAHVCEEIEPCGAENPQPLFLIRAVKVLRAVPLKGGRHLRYSFQKGGCTFDALLFGADRPGARFAPGECMDLAASLAPNVYNGRESLSVVLRDARPTRLFEEDGRRYAEFRRRLANGEENAAKEASVPARADFAAVYRLLAAQAGGGGLDEPKLCGELCARVAGFDYFKFRLVLDVFSELGLLHIVKRSGQSFFEIHNGVKIDLARSELLQALSGAAQTAARR